MCRDIEQALRFFEMAAKQGHDLAQFNVGFCKLFSRGGDFDPVQVSLSCLSSKLFSRGGVLDPVQVSLSCLFLMI